jgi:DNA excision repair protein ERCC-2
MTQPGHPGLSRPLEIQDAGNETGHSHVSKQALAAVTDSETRKDCLKKNLNIAVRDLVEYVCRSGDLAHEFFGIRRTLEAIRAHQKIQLSRPEPYRAEVVVSHRVETDRFVLNLGGRIDGVLPPSSAAPSEPGIVEEIKTTARDLEDIQPGEQALHWAQAKVYAYIYALQSELDRIDIHLTYFQLDSEKIRQERKSFDMGELEAFFDDLVQRYLAWAQVLIDWQDIRDDSIRALEFPFETYRPGQRRMAVNVYRGIKNAGQLIVQAPTGIGKTMAAVFPAVKALADGYTSKIFYLTARTPVRTVAEKAVDDLRCRGLRLKSLTLTAKDKICFEPDATCSADECEFAAGYYDRLHDALPQAFQKDALTRETVEALARDFRLCPFEFSLELSNYADCIVCDYNYAFDPRVYLRRFFMEAGGEYTFLIDEAHNLVDRSREMFSAELSQKAFMDLRRSLKTALPGLHRTMGRIVKALSKGGGSGEIPDSPAADEHAPDDILPLLTSFLKQAEGWLTKNQKDEFREALLQLYFTVSAFVNILLRYDETYRTCYIPEHPDLRVKLLCIDPSGQLAEALTRCRAAVFFSATLAPLTYFKRMFGCDESVDSMVLPSPFAPENFGLFISNRISTLYKHRRHTAGDVGRMLAVLARQKKGNYLFYFPSYAYLQLVYDIFRSECPRIQTLVQSPEMTEKARCDFLNHFASDNAETLAGFAVMGGIFGEGIDLVGDRLSAAAIVGVGLPGISLEKELIREYFDRFEGSGFAYAYTYPGINRVLQAAGRVIRTESDRGAVLLIDSRYNLPRYRRLLPLDWQPVWIGNTDEMTARLHKFWQG